MKKLLIEIRGGIIVNTGSNIPDLQILIVDHDKTDIGEPPLSGILSPDWVGENMYECMDADNPRDQEVYDELKRIKF